MSKRQTTVLRVTIDHDKPIASITDLVAGRAYTIDGVINAEASLDIASKAPSTEATDGLLLCMAAVIDPRILDPIQVAQFDLFAKPGAFQQHLNRLLTIVRDLHKECTGRGSYDREDETRLAQRLRALQQENSADASTRVHHEVA